MPWTFSRSPGAARRIQEHAEAQRAAAEEARLEILARFEALQALGPLQVPTHVPAVTTEWVSVVNTHFPSDYYRLPTDALADSRYPVDDFNI